MMREIFKAGQMPDKIDGDLVEKMAEKLNKGVEEGFGRKLENIDYDTPDFEMEASLKKDVWQFSGAKNYQQMKAMTEALTAPNGKLRSFAEFKRTVRPIIEDHIQWLETEYRTAIASSQMAAKWVRIKKNAKTLPYLQFDAVLDDRTTELCKGLDGVIKRVDDPFWEVWYPPNHFNCRSDVRQLRKGTVTPDEDIHFPDIPTMFRTNVAQQGLIFPPGSSYYKGLPEKIKKQASNQLAQKILRDTKKNFQKKNRTIQRSELKKEIEISNRSLKDLINHDVQQHNDLKNIFIEKIDGILKNAEYLGKTPPNQKNLSTVSWSHIFKIEIKNIETYVIVNEYKLGDKLSPKAFSQNKKILEELIPYKKSIE